LSLDSGSLLSVQGCGIVYVSTMCDRYVEEAFLSAETVKQRFPGLHITLFTDRPTHELCGTRCFDCVEAINSVTDISVDWAAGQLNRLRCLSRTPYMHTLHLDTDTRVLTEELPWLFGRLKEVDVALVEKSTDDSYSRRNFGRRMFSAGFVLYRRNPTTWAWLEAWVKLSERNFRLAEQFPLPTVETLSHIASEDIRRRLLRMDQISLVELLSPDINQFGLVVECLDYSWNYAGSRLSSNRRVPIKVLHVPALKDLTRADIVSVAFAWKKAGLKDDADLLYGYIDKLYSAPVRPSET
jgi:hypothetical protein